MLEKLSTGEAEAAERVFRELRAVSARWSGDGSKAPLRSKFDSMDVVQSVWAEVLKGFRDKEREFADRAHLRAFLRGWPTTTL